MLLARQVTKVASQRRTVACSAANDAVARRAALVALPALFLAPKAAQALIPGEAPSKRAETKWMTRRCKRTLRLKQSCSNIQHSYDPTAAMPASKLSLGSHVCVRA